MKAQNIWWAGAVICLFGGFLMVAQHDTIDSIALGNAVSVMGYIIALAGTVGCLLMVYKYSPKDKR